jgi:hypothetical protein
MNMDNFNQPGSGSMTETLSADCQPIVNQEQKPLSIDEELVMRGLTPMEVARLWELKDIIANSTKEVEEILRKVRES